MVAITGAAGLLGISLTERFLAEGVGVLALHRAGRDKRVPSGAKKLAADVMDPLSLLEAFQGVDTVIHAAAFVSFNPRQRKKILAVNVEGTHHVVNACLKSGVRHLIHVSSVAALGRVPGNVIAEDARWTSEMSSDYGQSKHLAELEVFRGAEEGLTVGMVNPSVILSASRPHRSSATLLDYVWNERPFYVDGLLNYVDAREVTDAVWRLYRNPRPGQKFILSAGSVTFREFFEKVAREFRKKPASIRVSPRLAFWAGCLEEARGWITGKEPTVTRVTARLAQHSFHYTNTKAQNELGIKFRSLDESIAWCCTEYKRNVNANK